MSYAQKPLQITPLQNQPGRYRWLVLLVLYFTYATGFANRMNIGVLLPFITAEFQISNTVAGSLASFFFIGYVSSQLPAGLWFSKFGVQKLAAFCILGFSSFGYLLGTAASTFTMAWYRFGLGCFQGPISVGANAMINVWFPPREKGTVSGIFASSGMFTLITVPPFCTWIALHYGWRAAFTACALPGIALSFLWYFIVKNNPRECPLCSEAEREYIRSVEPSTAPNPTSLPLLQNSFSRVLQKYLPIKQLLLESNSQVFHSWNIWGCTCAYFFILCVYYGLLTWIPSYLVNARHYSFLQMGVVASTPWIGGFQGAVIGGWLSDNLLQKRRKPTMLFTALMTSFTMMLLTQISDDPAALAFMLFATGLFFNIGFPQFMSYPMGFTSESTYPVAVALVNSGGNIGGFAAPIIAGALLDTYQDYDLVFLFFRFCAIAAFLLICFIDEPMAK